MDDDEAAAGFMPSVTSSTLIKSEFSEARLEPDVPDGDDGEDDAAVVKNEEDGSDAVMHFFRTYSTSFVG